MEYTEMLLQAARQHAAEILADADTLQELAVNMNADFDTKRAAVTAAKNIRLNACRILATSDEAVQDGEKRLVTIYPDVLLSQLQALIHDSFVGIADVKDLAKIMVAASEAGQKLCLRLTAPSPIKQTPKEAA